MQKRRQPDPPRLRPIAGRPPPHDLEAERAVLASVLLNGTEVLDEIAHAVRPADFYSDQHGLIYSTALELRADNQPIDLVTVAGRLRDREQLQRVGTPYLAQLVAETPAIANVTTHAVRLTTLAKDRAVIAEAQRIVAEGYGDRAPSFATDAARALADAAQVERTRRGAVLTAWRPLELGMLLSDPEPMPSLLRHPTLNGQDCAPGTGDTLLPLEKAGLLSSAGGVGKTMILIQLAISVIVGRPWLGHFHVSPEARGGRVLLGLGEENMKDVHRRVRPAALELELTEDECQLVADRLVILPLAGEPVALLARNPEGAIAETEELRAMRTMLERTVRRRCPQCRRIESHHGVDTCAGCGAYLAPERGWSLIVIDPLARWAGPDVESDNEAATRFVQAAESLCRAPGNPTVLVAHHSSKTARRTGDVDSRGVTAITDGFRWHATIKSQKAKVLFRQEKSNVSRPMTEDLELVRGRGGILRVATDEEERREEHFAEERLAERDAARTEADEQRIAHCMREIVEGLRRCKARITARSQLYSLMKGGRQQHKAAAVTRLQAEGRIVKEGGAFIVAPVPVSPSETTTQEEDHARSALF
jgi:hypothetical protein